MLLRLFTVQANSFEKACVRAYLFIGTPSSGLMDNCWQGSFDVSQGCPKLRQMGWVGLKGVDLQLVLKGFVLLHKRSDAGPSA